MRKGALWDCPFADNYGLKFETLDQREGSFQFIGEITLALVAVRSI